MIIDGRERWHDKITDDTAERIMRAIGDWTLYETRSKRGWLETLWAWVKGQP